MRIKNWLLFMICTSALAACGGGGGNDSPPAPPVADGGGSGGDSSGDSGDDGACGVSAQIDFVEAVTDSWRDSLATMAKVWT